MEQTFIGIDVSKDRLDVHVRPSDEAFAVARDGISWPRWSSVSARSIRVWWCWKPPAGSS